MHSLKRLILKTALSTEQSKASSYLMNSDGLCSCGRLIQKMEGKFLLGNIGPAESQDPFRRNTLTIAAYCYGCSTTINNLLKRLNGSAYKMGGGEADLRG